MRAELQGANIVFLDPDNGVGNAGERHTTVEEVSAMRQPALRQTTAQRFA
jgi:hypothetical protein